MREICGIGFGAIPAARIFHHCDVVAVLLAVCKTFGAAGEGATDLLGGIGTACPAHDAGAYAGRVGYVLENPLLRAGAGLDRAHGLLVENNVLGQNTL